MRKIYIVDHEWPPTTEDLAAAEAAGATEVLCGGGSALARLGVATFGFHELSPPLDVMKAEKVAAINALREEKIAGGFDHAGHRFQSRQSDRENVIDAAVGANLAIAQGAQPGNLRWADPDEDFGWITANNSEVPMDPYDVLDLFQAGVAFKTRLTFYARAIKDIVLAAPDPATLDAIDITTGWPR